MEMFNNYPKILSPDNEFEYQEGKEHNVIVVNGNCDNYFEVLFPYSELITDIKVIYNQTERLNYVKEIVEHFDYSDRFIIRVRFTPEETLQFSNTNIDTFAQVRLVVADEVIFTDKFKVLIVETLERKSEGD